MTTKQAYKEIDKEYTAKLKKYGLCYCLKKIRNICGWVVQIGKFDKITTPYTQGEILEYHGTLQEQFDDILNIEINNN